MPAVMTEKKAVRTAVKPKKVVRKKSPEQTTLEQLLREHTSHSSQTDKVLDLLTKMSRAPQIIVNSASDAAPSHSDGANARLDALVSIFSGKGIQSLLEDILSSGKPPTREALLRLADNHINQRMAA